MKCINFLIDQVQHVLFWTGDFFEMGVLELLQCVLRGKDSD